MLVNMRSKAEQDLDFIRAAMDRAEGTSSVSGLGGMLMGVVGIAAAVWAQNQFLVTDQLLCWIYAALAAVVVGGVASVNKARLSSGAVHWDPLRRFVLCLLPSLVVGAVLTAALWSRLWLQAGSAADTYPHELVGLIPAMWMLCYGCGVVAAGSYSVQPVRWMGLCFMLMGMITLVLPGWFNVLLGAAFGGLHLIFGIWVYKKHGG
ncbi:MAG: hypothetical protein AAF993_11460 [Pseudomonadota bacterium]